MSKSKNRWDRFVQLRSGLGQRIEAAIEFAANWMRTNRQWRITRGDIRHAINRFRQKRPAPKWIRRFMIDYPTAVPA